MNKTTIIVPAYNEAACISRTLQTLRESSLLADGQLIVVDDGSEDDTPYQAAAWADVVVRLTQNTGKGMALWHGIEAAAGERFLFVDADLGRTAVYAARLLDELEDGVCEMAIACPPAAERGGFGLVKRQARRSIKRKTGITIQAPLSGQRALTRRAIDVIGNWNCGFGIEAAMTLDVLQAGFSVREVPLPIRHREHGKSLSGFWHRGRQWLAIRKALMKREETGR